MAGPSPGSPHLGSVKVFVYHCLLASTLALFCGANCPDPLWESALLYPTLLASANAPMTVIFPGPVFPPRGLVWCCVRLLIDAVYTPGLKTSLL